MDKLLPVLLAGSPFRCFVLWAAWWLISDALRERRRARAAVRLAGQDESRPGERGGHGQASVAIWRNCRDPAPISCLLAYASSGGFTA